MIGTAVALAERAPLPDALLRAAVALLVGRTDRGLRNQAGAAVKFAHEMPAFAIAEHTAAANAQHYEVPAEFFQNVLGPHMKYSCCFYREAETSLGDAEADALQLTAEHADLRDGQHILELGCGWGSLSLWMAQHYPAARITAVSNSASQRAHIEQQARERGLGNLTVLTADINVFEPGARFDRIVSVEMFEHLSNWAAILRRARGWMKPDGRLFLHVFSHDVAPYRFDHGNKADFIAQHFFTGGIMPSHDLIAQFSDLFAIEKDWRWSGEHYARTARAWLANYDANAAAITRVLEDVYGADARIWQRRWRLFFLATEGLFGYRGGAPWGVSHYRLRPTA